MEENKPSEFAEKVLMGLKVSYQKLIEKKKLTNSSIVVSRNGKIEWIKPWEEENESSE